MLFHIDPHTGKHTVIAQSGLCCGNGQPRGVAIEADGQIIVANGALPGSDILVAIVRVNPADGTQAIVSEGGYLIGPTAVAIAPNGDIFVSDRTEDGFSTVIRIDPLTGDQTLVTESTPAEGGAVWKLTVVPLPITPKKP